MAMTLAQASFGNGVIKTRPLGAGAAYLRAAAKSPTRGVSLRQPVTARSFKTRETETRAIDQSDEAVQKYQEIASNLKAKWDETEEKPAVVAITLSAFVAIWAASGVVDAVNKLPLIGGLLEFVGLIVTGWFGYRYLVFGPDRQELKSNIENFLKKVTGKTSSQL